MERLKNIVKPAYPEPDKEKLGINDVLHTTCRTPLVMRRTESMYESIRPYCPKCDKFPQANQMEINPHWWTQGKIIEVIKVMARVEFRVAEMKPVYEQERT